MESENKVRVHSENRVSLSRNGVTGELVHDFRKSQNLSALTRERDVLKKTSAAGTCLGDIWPSSDKKV